MSGVSTAVARDSRYRNLTYGDLAYDLDRDSRETMLRHAGEPRREEVAKVRSVPHVRARERQKVSAVAVVGFAAVAAMTILLLMSYVKLTVISDAVVELQGQLGELETENVALTAQYQQTFDLSAVKEAAMAAGMSKPSSSQIYYIDLSGEDSVVVYQKTEGSLFSRLLASLNQGIYAVVEYFE
ncbi:hypothetical protein H8790_09230 [Oscillibacter hominis]|uniref:Cell division protein FtsL n=1 Tax=Oscillibacter hominis TaxID=2763056 RepID=A0A7G9B271_9FIRM|nr:hypothetical protein H8790_09230 [Oscillibacter hominis]